MFKYYANPANWMLSDYDKEITKAKYRFSGEDLKKELLGVELKYKNISEYEYDTKINDLNLNSLDDTGQAKELLTIQLKHSKMTQHEHDKEIANINDEPYVRVIDMTLDKKNPAAGFFEIDFNSHFVEHLMANGYVGPNNEDIVDAWFNDLCKNVALEDLQDEDGVAKSFLTDSKEGELITRIKNDDGTADYF